MAAFRHLAAALFLVLCPAAAAQEKPVFVELVYELDVTSLDGRSLPALRADEPPLGYVVADFPAGRILYPATGAGMPSTHDGAPLVGFRLRSHLLEHGGSMPDAKRLLAPEPGPFSEPIAGDDRLTPPTPYTLTMRDGAVAEVAADGETVAVAPGEFVAVATASRRLDRAEVIAALREAAGPDAEPDDPALERETDLLLLGENAVTIHTRLSVANFGRVAISRTDLMTAWSEARRLAQEGPYPRAAETLETVLAAIPGLAEARRLLERTEALIEAGVTPVRAVGRLQFPEGPPDPSVEALWDALYPGLATFEPLGAPPAVLAVPAGIADGAFTAFIATGHWRVTVDVPGYETARVTVTADRELEFDVPLRRAP